MESILGQDNSYLIGKTLKKLLCGRSPVVLCIGSDRVTGDALGPLTGHILTRQLNVPAYVYGSLFSPVTALNLEETVRFIGRRHAGLPVLAVDSSVGKAEDVGMIRILSGGLYPGSADGKSLPKVGDVSVTATVTDAPTAPLTSVRLGFVYRLAESIASGIYDAVKESAERYA